MSVIKADLAAGGRQIKGVFNGYYINGVGQFLISGTVKFVVYSDTRDESPVSLLMSPLLPQIGALYVEGGRVFRRIIYKDATPTYVGIEGNYFRWEVTYTVEGINNGDDPTSDSSGNGAEDPVLLNFSITAEKEEYNSAYDLDGKANCNSLGEFFADPIAYNNAIVNFNFTRKEFVNPLGKMNAYWETHNAGTFWGLRPATLKVAEITANATQKLSGTEWEVSYKIQYRRRGWLQEKANTGYYCRTSWGIERAVNEDGSPTDAPVILNADGTRWTGGEVPVTYFRTTYPADFSGLNLPNPFYL